MGMSEFFDAETIAKRLHTQDNRITAHPIFVVEEQVRDFGYDPAYSEDIAWIDTANDCVEADASEWNELEEEWDSTGDERDGWTRTAYKDRWQFVQPFLTCDAAEKYISDNQHNLNKCRVFAASAHRNREWQLMRTLLMGMIDVDDV